jgi:hypothetical protein
MNRNDDIVKGHYYWQQIRKFATLKIWIQKLKINVYELVCILPSGD